MLDLYLYGLCCSDNYYNGCCSSCLSRLGRGQIFWHRSRPRCRIFHSTNRTKNQLCSWRRTWRCGWTCKLHFQKKALFSSLLRGPAAERYESNITNGTTWEDVRTTFITRFSDGRNKFRYRMEVESCIRGDGEEIRNFLHRIKRTVDKGWPDDMNGIEAAQQNAERAAQGRQRRQRYMDYSLRGLRPRYLQRKAQEYLMERPNATWNNFCAQIIQKDLILEVSSTFLSHEAQTKAELATLGQEIKNLRSELKEYHVNAVAMTSRSFHPDQQGRQKLTRFCNYCHKNGHTLNWCRKKMRDEEVRKIRNDMWSKREISPIHNELFHWAIQS